MGSPTKKKTDLEHFRCAPNVSDDLQWIARTTGKSKTAIFEEALQEKKKRLLKKLARQHGQAG